MGDFTNFLSHSLDDILTVFLWGFMKAFFFFVSYDHFVTILERKRRKKEDTPTRFTHLAGEKRYHVIHLFFDAGEGDGGTEKAAREYTVVCMGIWNMLGGLEG
ncbi:hypothetical protein BDZ91DRAFT_728806 [Kalaharituber pfeilii]|nr:hypothetical protein BDZ91DRAFT_728806 [Kalaharituber pfeilii]